jgi:putative FmdB family regulatory protein
MPLYEYECTQCGQVEEALQKFSDKPLSECRHCSGKLRKLISNTSFHLKGNGWYVTDYAKKTSNEAPSKTAEKTNSKAAETKTSSSNSTSGNSADQ